MAGWTVQDLIDEGMSLHAYCHNPDCGHNRKIDLAVLLDRLGPDAPAMSEDLAPRMRCDACGGKAVGLIYSPGKPAVGWVNPYIKAKGG